MTAKEVFEIMKERCSIPEDFSALSDVYGEIIEPLNWKTSAAITFKRGISKTVLISPDWSFVIKIPFKFWVEDEDDYPNAMEEWEQMGEESGFFKEPQPEDFLLPIQNACIEEFFYTPVWDYCATEVAIYQEAKNNCLDAYFAKEYLLGYIDDYPIYAQERAICFYDHETSRRKISKQEEDKIRSTPSGRFFNLNWTADFLRYYGQEELDRLVAFIKELDIRDFHEGNIGYLHGYPVLLDYSDWREDL